jgi:hypothetical protein
MLILSLLNFLTLCLLHILKAAGHAMADSGSRKEASEGEKTHSVASTGEQSSKNSELSMDGDATQKETGPLLA